MTSTTSPSLHHEVIAAVGDGAWTASEVASTLDVSLGATHSQIVATLWDLVDEGAAIPVTHGVEPEFHPTA